MLSRWGRGDTGAAGLSEQMGPEQPSVRHVFVSAGEDQQPGPGLLRGVVAGLRGAHREFVHLQNGSLVHTSLQRVRPVTCMPVNPSAPPGSEGQS